MLKGVLHGCNLRHKAIPQPPQRMGALVRLHHRLGRVRHAGNDPSAPRRSCRHHNGALPWCRRHAHHRRKPMPYGESLPRLWWRLLVYQARLWLRPRLPVRMVARAGLHRHFVGKRHRIRAHWQVFAGTGLPVWVPLRRGGIRRLFWRDSGHACRARRLWVHKLLKTPRRLDTQYGIRPYALLWRRALSAHRLNEGSGHHPRLQPTLRQIRLPRLWHLWHLRARAMGIRGIRVGFAWRERDALPG